MATERTALAVTIATRMRGGLEGGGGAAGYDRGCTTSPKIGTHGKAPQELGAFVVWRVGTPYIYMYFYRVFIKFFLLQVL